MAELIFLNILLLGAGALILLFIRALPRIEGTAAPDRRGMLERWMTSRLPERLDAVVRSVFLRALRRLKILTMRLDNGINRKLQRMKFEDTSGNMNGGKIDLKKVRDGAGEPPASGN